jgi:predicted metal-dependent hydrolase
MTENPPAQTITIKGVPFTITRKAVKILRITVHPDCRVTVTVPRSAGAQDLAAFIDAKLPWVEKHLARYREQERKKPLARNRFTDGEIHYVWGIPHVLKVIERRGNPKIVTGTETSGTQVLEMYLRPGSTAAQKQALLDRWRKSLVAKAAPILAARWEKALEAASGKRDLAVKKIYLQKMKTHWGSCNPARRTIRLNTELAAKPPECLDYVVLHEMVHFITSYHNRIFYGYMDKLMPSCAGRSGDAGRNGSVGLNGIAGRPGWKDIRKKMNRGEL